MRYANPSLLLCLSSLAGCALGDDSASSGKDDQPLTLSSAVHIDDEGVLEYGAMAFDSSPTTLLEPGDFHGYEFHGKAGGVVTISMTAKQCEEIDPMVHLFGPEDENGNRGTALAVSDDEASFSCRTDSLIPHFTLPKDGEYLIVATTWEQGGGGHYALRLACDNGACMPSDEMTFQKSRIAQADIDRGAFTAEQLFDIGDFLFEHMFTVDEGLGNNLVGGPAGSNPRPNFRSVHSGGFGAPEAQSCLTCHNVGGDDGGGDLNHNIFQNGDGVSKSTGLARNAPMVLGLGVRQQLAAEMTTELQSQLQAGKQKALNQGTRVRFPLSSKGVSFGTLVADQFGTVVDFTDLHGVDQDLVVKPFGWKGREATLRRFVEGGFRVHFGMQSSPSIAKHCATPDPNTFGTGTDCRDPDGDGVRDEITEGQLTAMATYMGLRQMPVRVPPATEAARTRAADGERLFANAGCANCHMAQMQLNNPVHIENGDTTGGSSTFDLTKDMKSPRLTRDTNGALEVELWTDFKRHDMGTELADSKPFKTIPAAQFITTPLWGVATSAPYMHDGRAPTLRDAILAHGGEAATSRTAFTILSKDDQQKLIDFLSTLGRDDAEPVPSTTTNFTPAPY